MTSQRTQKSDTPPLSLSNVSTRQLLELVNQFIQQHPPPVTRGRKPVYSEAFILTLALLRETRSLSFRQLRSRIIPELLADGTTPSLGTLAHRLHRVSQERRHALLGWLAQRLGALQ
jgi:hypothetical protein